MKKPWFVRFQKSVAVCWLLLMIGEPRGLVAEPTAAALAVFEAYRCAVEARLARQHRSANAFLAVGGGEAGLRGGVLRIEHVKEPAESSSEGNVSGAMLHHWRGTAFAAGARAVDFERLMRDFAGYPEYFAPQVLLAKAIALDGDHMQASMRVRQRHVIPVVMDSTYDVRFGRLDAGHGYSISRSMRVAEIEAAGTGAERVLSAGEEHGFLWRLNTYWSYEERDGGLYLQVEAVSLTRAIPRGLGWAIQPYVESIPRESLEFTLRSVCAALRK